MSSPLDRIEAEAKEHIAVRDQHYAEYGEGHFCEDYGCHNMGRFAVDVLALVNVAKAAEVVTRGALDDDEEDWPEMRRLRNELGVLNPPADSEGARFSYEFDSKGRPHPVREAYVTIREVDRDLLVNVAKAAEDIRPYSPDEIRPGTSATTYLIPTDRVERLRLALAALDKAGGK